MFDIMIFRKIWKNVICYFDPKYLSKLENLFIAVSENLVIPLISDAKNKSIYVSCTNISNQLFSSKNQVFMLERVQVQAVEGDPPPAYQEFLGNIITQTADHDADLNNAATALMSLSNLSELGGNTASLLPSLPPTVAVQAIAPALHDHLGAARVPATGQLIPDNIPPHPVLTRRPGRPKKPVPAPNAPSQLQSNANAAPVQQPQQTFGLLIHLMREDIKVRERGKTKTQKQEPLKRGPISLAFDTDWDTFRSLVAKAAGVPVNYLTIESFEYQISVPATSPKVPVNSEEGLQLMVQQLQAHTISSKKPLPLVILRMSNPQYVPPVSASFDLLNGSDRL